MVVPDAGYLRSAHQLLQKHNALLIADEVQTGLGRTGKILASHHDGVQPDILVLGKALSGGIYPVSAVLANDEVHMTPPGPCGISALLQRFQNVVVAAAFGCMYFTLRHRMPFRTLFYGCGGHIQPQIQALPCMAIACRQHNIMRSCST